MSCDSPIHGQGGAPVGRPRRPQARSLIRRERIAAAATRVLAEHGLVGLTHRLVAREAEVSLSATTYHYRGMFDIVAEASSLVLATQIDRLDQAVDAIRQDRKPDTALMGLITEVSRMAAFQDRASSLAWAEILLDARRHPESRSLSTAAFETLGAAWRRAADICGVPDPALASRSGLDMTLGLFMMATPLGLSVAQFDAVMQQGADPLVAWHIEGEGEFEALVRRLSPKSEQTRKRVLEAALDIMTAEGVGAVTFRAIAERTGLTAAAPMYHFPTVASLLAEAQTRLFDQLKQRYRAAAIAPGGRPTDLVHLTDVIVTNLVRESTEYADLSVIIRSIWLQAAREPELRPLIWSIIADQQRGWMRAFAPISATLRPLDALLAQALYFGKLIRIVSTGSHTEDLALTRREFTVSLDHILRPAPRA